MKLKPLAYRLLDAGIPVVVCKPCPGYGIPGKCKKKGHDKGKRELHWPWKWDEVTAEQARADLSEFRIGDTLAMVTGHGLDVVDVDPKSDGSIDNLPPFKEYGRNTTPSGGTHHLVPSSGLAKMPLTTVHGHVGDYCGGTPEGEGRALVYLPLSRRPKYPDGDYAETSVWAIAACLGASPDPDLVAALQSAGGRTRREKKDKYVDDSPVRDERLGPHPAAKEKVAAAFVALMTLGADDAWDNSIFKHACTLHEYGNSNWSGYDLEDLHARFLEMAPVDADWDTDDNEAKWDSAAVKVSGGGVPCPSDAAEVFGDIEDEQAAEQGDVCPPRAKRERKPVDLSWFPKCGLTREAVTAKDTPKRARKFGNLLAEANLDCEVPFLFRRGGGLAYVGYSETTGEIHVQDVSRDVLRAMLTRVGHLMRWDKARQEWVPDNGPIPADVVTTVAVMAMSDERIPIFKSVMRSPVLMPDGETWADHDMEVDGMLVRLRKDAGYTEAPHDPSSAQIAKAVARIRDITREIKFAHPAGLASLVAHSVGLACGPYLRHAVPMTAVTAGNQANGKSVAIDIADALAVHASERMVIPAANLQEGEIQKRIDTALKSPARSVTIGNFPPEQTLESSTLSEYITTDGAVDIRDYRNNTVATTVYRSQAWSASGNNYGCDKDLSIRSFFIEIDAGVPDGTDIVWETRDIKTRLKVEHAELNHALRTVINAALRRLEQDTTYLDDVERRTQGVLRGDFYKWGIVSCAVADVLGVNEFGSDQERFKDDRKVSNPDKGLVDQVVTAMSGCDAKVMRVGQSASAILEASESLQSEFATPAELGLWLRKHQDQWGEDPSGKSWQIKDRGKRLWSLNAEAD